MMFKEFGEILKSLNSPSDWAVVLAAGTAGLVVDGAINIVPIPFFSPGICGVTAATTALAFKRGIEAESLRSRDKELSQLLAQEADEIAAALNAAGKNSEAEELRFEAKTCRIRRDAERLEVAIKAARVHLRPPT